MKTQMSFLLVLSWIWVVAAHAAQPSGNDVSVRVFNSADITVPNMNPGEWTSLTFNSERWDTANLHETTTNSGRLKASVAGKYYIFANITWESPIASGLWGLRLQLNGKPSSLNKACRTRRLRLEFQCRLELFMRSLRAIMSKPKYFRTMVTRC